MCRASAPSQGRKVAHAWPSGTCPGGATGDRRVGSGPAACGVGKTSCVPLTLLPERMRRRETPGDIWRRREIAVGAGRHRETPGDVGTPRDAGRHREKPGAAETPGATGTRRGNARGVTTGRTHGMLAHRPSSERLCQLAGVTTVRTHGMLAYGSGPWWPPTAVPVPGTPTGAVPVPILGAAALPPLPPSGPSPCASQLGMRVLAWHGRVQGHLCCPLATCRKLPAARGSVRRCHPVRVASTAEVRTREGPAGSLTGRPRANRYCSG